MLCCTLFLTPLSTLAMSIEYFTNICFYLQMEDILVQRNMQEQWQRNTLLLLLVCLQEEVSMLPGLSFHDSFFLKELNQTNIKLVCCESDV